SAGTLSGGESQRIRLATQIGSNLSGVLYILDEPSIGLHQRDNDRLIASLKKMRDLGNTLIVVEHDEDTMREADWLIDVGPGAGVFGGEIVAAGTPAQVAKNKKSITGQYLSGKREIPVPLERRVGNGRFIEITGAAENNLQNITARFPLGKFIAVTGVSGSGKSTLVNSILKKTLAQRLNRNSDKPGKFKTISGVDYIDRLIDIDQSPIGRTPRSNPATYTGVFDDIRDLFAQTNEAKIRGYKKGRFSFNVKGGRCEACSGDGIIKIEMHFLPDVYVPCEVCHGRRYNSETLEVHYKEKNISQILDMTVNDAVDFFKHIPKINRKLQTIKDVGLGYVTLGQPATTLSGGEAQRMKLASELHKRSTGKSLYILDEPTTGLHTEDISRLLRVLDRFVDDGNTVLVIEHNLDVINIFDKDISENAFTDKEGMTYQNSDFLNGCTNFSEAVDKVLAALEAKGAGKAKVNYRLRDAVFSRQRYWGEPFPVYYENGLPQMIGEEYLPILLPKVEKYLPTEEGNPPLGNATTWAWDTANHKVVGNELIDNQTIFPLELNTMPGWAGSSWYWLEYMMEKGARGTFPTKAIVDYWQNVDLYVGGSEHATGHLLYSRFWNKFLKDRGFAPTEEPFKKLINQGMILGMSAFAYRLEGTNTFVSKNQVKGQSVQPIHVDVSLLKDTSDELDIDKFKAWRKEFANAEFILEEDGKYITGREVEKMSKSKYNVVNPDDICEQYGADTLRLYEMFLGPLEQAKPWNTAGISGVYNFLRKLWRLYFNDNGWQVTDEAPTPEMLKALHKTIKKVNEDIENFSFNTSVSQFMICVNELSSLKCHHRDVLAPLAVLVAPFAPHIAEELWKRLGNTESVTYAPYPIHEDKYLQEDSKEYPVSFNGKVRFKRAYATSMSVSEIEQAILADPQTAEQLQGNTPKKVIVVPNRIINIVM
ncbi:MAG: excinuclease ABC subunit UvrA, partial [Capnocytophaga ochracea]